MASIFEQAESFKRDLLKRDKAAADRLIDAYAIAWKEIKKQLDALTKQMTEAKLRGEVISQAWLSRQARYLSLLRQVGEQLGKFAEIAGQEITREQRKAVQVAEADAQRLLLVGAEAAGVEASFNQLPRSAVENIVGFLGNGSPLRILLDELPRRAGVRIADILTIGVATGRSPREMARDIRDQADIGLTRALTIARTETLRAYREATHQSYSENGDLVYGWYWVTALQSRSCAACIALHGTFHPITERQAAHVNCRCTQVPALQGEPSPVPQTGEQWFEKQSAATKREILDSDAAYEGVRDRRVRLRDFVGRRDSIEWGPSYVALPVGRAINGEGWFPANERPREPISKVVPREESGPQGTPVGNALKLPKKGNLASVGRKVIDLINRIHGDGNLPQIEVKQNASKETNGTYYWHFGPLRPGMIKISSLGDHPELTLAHEIGHFLDHQGIGNPRNMETLDGDAFARFFKATSESEAINRLNDQLHLRSYDLTLTDGRKVKEPVNRPFLQYLLRKQEIWARAYAQWITLRSGDQVMLEQLRRLRENIHPGSANSQWSDGDFEPIAREIDALMEKLGWRKP